MSDRMFAVAMLIAGSVIAAVVNSLFRSRNEQGKRLGRLETWMDFERGRQAGRRERDGR